MVLSATLITGAAVSGMPLYHAETVGSNAKCTSDTKIRPSEAAGRKKYEILSGDSLTAKSVAVSGILSEIIKEQVILFFNM